MWISCDSMSFIVFIIPYSSLFLINLWIPGGQGLYMSFISLISSGLLGMACMHLQFGLDDSVVGGPMVSKDCSLVLLSHLVSLPSNLGASGASIEPK